MVVDDLYRHFLRSLRVSTQTFEIWSRIAGDLETITLDCLVVCMFVPSSGRVIHHPPLEYVLTAPEDSETGQLDSTGRKCGYEASPEEIP